MREFKTLPKRRVIWLILTLALVDCRPQMEVTLELNLNETATNWNARSIPLAKEFSTDASFIQDVPQVYAN